MKEFTAYIYILFYFLGTSLLAADTPGNVFIEISASTSQFSVGDSLSIFCDITTPSGTKTGKPYLKDESPFLDIEKQWQETNVTDSASITNRFGFLIYVFAPDSLIVGPFAAEYTSNDGKSEIILSNTIVMYLNSKVDNVESPPLPNRNPMEIASAGISLWLLLIVVALITILLLAYFLYRKKTSPISILQEPIDEIAEFEKIRQLKLHDSGRLKELYILISSAMRGFIHRNMEFEALYETTEEILNNLSNTSVDSRVKNAISEILQESRKVIFAKYNPPPELSSSVIDRALEPVKTVLEAIARENEKVADEEIEEHLKTSILKPGR